MRLSCLPVTFFQDIIEGRMTIEAWIDLAASLRLDGVDFSQAWCGNLSPQTIAGLRARVADKGLQACMISCAPDFTHPEPAGRRATLDGMRRMLELATGLGVPLLRVTAGQAHPSVSRARGVAFLKREAGFDGWISIEEYSRTGEQGFRDAVRFVREAWDAA